MASTSSPSLPLPLSTPTSSSLTATKASPFATSRPPNPTLKTPTIRSRLSKLCQEGQPHLARQLFDTIPRPTTVLWNTIIIGFICNNLPLEALLFYSRMKASASKCDSYTYSSTLKACAETRNLRVGKAIHCHFIRCLSYPSRIVYNSLLNMYSTCLSEMVCFDYFDFSKYDAVRRVFEVMHKRDVVAWNTLVSWYVKTQRYVQAVKQFRLMLRIGIKPSPVSFVNVLPAVSGIIDYKNAVVLYGMLLKLGDDYMNDMFVISSVISMFSDLGSVDLGRKVFDNCLQKNIEVWNTMIGGYVQNDCNVEGVECFLEAVETGQLDDVTFLSALTATSQLQCLNLAQQLHAFVIKNLPVIPVIILNAIIVMYSRCGYVYRAFEVFEKMTRRDEVSWNTMVSAFVQHGMDDEGLMLVYEMQNQKFALDSVTATALLSAASNLRNQEIGRQTHAYLLRHGIRFEGMDGYLIDMYAKCGLIRTAKQIFEMSNLKQRDLATWNAMIAGYTQHGLIEEAFFTFRQMLAQNVMLNAVTLASTLPACSQMGNINLGKNLHGVSIRHLLDKNIFVSTALVDMYSKSGAIKYSERVFSKSSEKNSITYTTIIMGYGQHGMAERALSLFYSMQKSGIEPDAITFVAILSSCSHAGLVDEGLKIFESMERDYNIPPSVQHYCCVTDMLGRVGKVVEAYEFVTSLGDKGNVMEIWGSLLGACRLHGHVELGEIVANKLNETNLAHNSPGYEVLLSNIYANEGNWRNVDRVRKEMREKGLRKESGCSWIDIGGCVTRFVSKDRDHHQSDEIYDMLRGLASEMKDAGQNICPVHG